MAAGAQAQGRATRPRGRREAAKLSGRRETFHPNEADLANPRWRGDRPFDGGIARL